MTWELKQGVKPFWTCAGIKPEITFPLERKANGQCPSPLWVFEQSEGKIILKIKVKRLTKEDFLFYDDFNSDFTA